MVEGQCILSSRLTCLASEFVPDCPSPIFFPRIDARSRSPQFFKTRNISAINLRFKNVFLMRVPADECEQSALWLCL